MGLDQYAFSCNVDELGESQVDFDRPYSEPSQIAYWRKHPDLQGWMENLYIKKGGAEEQFNCVNVRLVEEDLMNLKRDILNHNLPETSGPFFGISYYAPEDIKYDLDFVNKALECLREGGAVYYTSWW